METQRREGLVEDPAVSQSCPRGLGLSLTPTPLSTPLGEEEPLADGGGHDPPGPKFLSQRCHSRAFWTGTVSTCTPFLAGGSPERETVVTKVC